MPDVLTKKIGPLPLWAWVAIMGATIGVVVIYQRSRSSAAVDSTTSDQGAGALFDPTTGAPYAGGDFGGGGGITGSVAPYDDTRAFNAAISDSLDQWVAAHPTQTQSPLIALAPGAKYYDPNTGETVDGPEQKAVAQTSSNPTTPKSTALARAEKAVTTGKVGPRNLNTLLKAGYSKAQINYHLAHKTPLQQPAGKKTATKTPKKTVTPVHAAATHPNQHENVATPHHGAHPSPAERAWDAGHHTISYAQHVKNMSK